MLIDGTTLYLVITINSTEHGFPGAWNNGNPYENALTLLHELGHVFNNLAGAGGFKLPDADNSKFDAEIKKNCFTF